MRFLFVLLLLACGPSPCEKAGGRVERRNCRTYPTVVYVKAGKAWIPVTTFHKSCDYVCVGGQRP